MSPSLRRVRWSNRRANSLIWWWCLLDRGITLSFFRRAQLNTTSATLRECFSVSRMTFRGHCVVEMLLYRLMRVRACEREKVCVKIWPQTCLVWLMDRILLHKVGHRFWILIDGSTPSSQGSSSSLDDHRHVTNYVLLPLEWCVTKNINHERRDQLGTTPMIPLSPYFEKRLRHHDTVVELN